MPSRDESHVTSTAARITTHALCVPWCVPTLRCDGRRAHPAETRRTPTLRGEPSRNGMGRETQGAAERRSMCEAGFTPRFPSVCWWRCRSPDPRRETPPSHSKHREAIDRPSMGWEASEISDAQLPAGRARTAKQQACVRIPAALHIFYAYTDAALRRSTFGAPGQPCVKHSPPLVSCSRHGVQFCCAALPVRFFSGKHFGDDVRAASSLCDMGRRHAGRSRAQQTRQWSRRASGPTNACQVVPGQRLVWNAGVSTRWVCPIKVQAAARVL